MTNKLEKEILESPAGNFLGIKAQLSPEKMQ